MAGRKFFISESLSSPSDASADLDGSWGLTSNAVATARETTAGDAATAAGRAGAAVALPPTAAVVHMAEPAAAGRHRRSTSETAPDGTALASTTGFSAGFHTSVSVSSSPDADSMNEEDEVVPSMSGATAPVPIKQSADGLFCKVHVGPVVSPPSSLLSEQLKRSPTMDARVPLLGPNGLGPSGLAIPGLSGSTSARRTSASATYGTRRPVDATARRVDDRTPPVLIEGTESLRRQLVQERAPVLFVPRTSPLANGEIPDTSVGVFSYRSKVTGW